MRDDVQRWVTTLRERLDALLHGRRRFIDLFHHAPEPYMVTDPFGEIKQANVAAGTLLDTPPEHLVGGHLTAFLPPEDRAGFSEVLRAAGEDPTSRELAMAPRHHPPVVVAATVVERASVGGRDTELRWMLRDVTDQRRAQAALQEAFAHTREEAEELRDLDRWRDAFLAASAHDLHAPLRVVGTTVRTLLADHELGAATPLVDRIGNEVGRLTRLLDDVLDLDQFTRGAGTAERVPTDLAELAARVLADAQVDVSDVELDVPPVVADVDPRRTGQILTNLVQNACSHTAPGTPIRVAVSVVDGGVDLVVEDEGPGVPPSLREEVFHPFVTRRACDDGHVGTGLGLSLVRLFAELHQGTAHVEDRPGGGTRVVVHLPAHLGQ